MRYFNPASAHRSDQIGENPKGTPNNLFPYLAQVVSSRHPLLTIFGDTYPTCDGTSERDYIHIMDVAHAHLVTLEQSEVHLDFKPWPLVPDTTSHYENLSQHFAKYSASLSR